MADTTWTNPIASICAFGESFAQLIGGTLDYAPEINAYSFSINEVTIIVTPSGKTYENAGRKVVESTTDIEVFFGRSSDGSADDVKSFAEYVESSAQEFMRMRIDSYVCIGFEYNPIFDVDLLKQNRILAGTVLFHFKAYGEA